MTSQSYMLQRWTTCKVSQMSVSQHVSPGTGLHSLKQENTAPQATNPNDSLTETETTFKHKLSMEQYFDVPRV